MKWFDTHCHLDCEPLLSNLHSILNEARFAGIEKFLIPGIRGSVINADFPDYVYKAWGIHPGACGDFTVDDVQPLFQKVDYVPCAIGECGLDVKSANPIPHQINIFTAQIAIAKKLNVPLLIHLRGAWNQALDILKSHGEGIPWIMHAFSGTKEIADLFIKAGAYISFAGSILISGGKKTPQVARFVPSDRLLIETDAPDMRPYLGNKDHSEPSILPRIAETVAKLRNCTPTEICDTVARNCEKLFGWK